jgi:hypothetical protein
LPLEVKALSLCETSVIISVDTVISQNSGIFSNAVERNSNFAYWNFATNSVNRMMRVEKGRYGEIGFTAAC